ncbi:MAG: alkaline phosphatase family protein [Candidatus Latescibacteria bacterium]|nr:alkaline phosphatase family protein [Candidatus Latescibacterota bacterium]
MNYCVFAETFSVAFNQKPEHVVLFIIDGLSYKVWDRMDLPVLEAMIDGGVLVEKNYLPTAAHPTSGAYAEIHSGSIPNPVLMAGTVFITKETGYLQDSFFHAKITAFAANTVSYRTLTNNYHYVFQKDGRDAEAVDMALRFMEEGKPAFLRLHLQDSGGAGSQSLWADEKDFWRWNIWAENSPYRKTVARADSLLGEFITGLEKLGILDKTAFVVMGDHGQNDTGWHPPEYIDSAITSIVLWGAGFKKGVRIPYSEQIDVAPTVCALMEVTPPETCRGRLIAEALETYDGESLPRKMLIKELLDQFIDYRRKMTEAMYAVERIPAGNQAVLFTRLSRGIRQNFYDIERFSEWPRFDSLDELVQHNSKVLKNLDIVLSEAESILHK